MLSIENEAHRLTDLLVTQQNQINEELQQAILEVDKLTKERNAVREQGDLRENAGFEDASEALARAESKRRRLERKQLLLSSENFINYVADGFIGPGTTVILRKYEHETYHPERAIKLVARELSDPEKGLISLECPVGKTIQGHQKDDIVQVRSNSKLLAYRIMEVL